MVSTLRITSVVAVIFAGLLVVLVVGPKSVVPGLLERFAIGSDEEVDRILQAPSVVDLFREDHGDRQADRPETHPLVSQAEAFAKVINPPTLAPKPLPKPQGRGTRPSIRPTGPTTSKFALVGTSFIASDPASSFAFIRLQDKTHQWVRIGDSVGHQIVKEIKHGAIVLRDGQSDVEMAVEAVPDTANMLEGGQTPAVPTKTASVPTRSLAPASGRITGRPVPRPWSQKSAETDFDAVQRENMEKLVEQIRRAKQGGASSGQKTAEIQKMIAEYKEYQSSRVSPEEAEELEDLGREMNESRKTPPRGSRVNLDRKLGVRRPGKK